MRKFLVVLFLVLVSSCALLGRNRAGRLHAPEHLRGQIHGEINALRACHQQRGLRSGDPFREGKSLTVKIIPGDRKQSGEWIVHRYGRWMAGYYIGGCRSSGTAYIPAHPQTGGEVTWGVVRHEIQHWLLISLGIECAVQHPPAYRPCVIRWYDMAELAEFEGEDPAVRINVHRTLDDGTFVCVTFVVFEEDIHVMGELNDLPDEFFRSLAQEPGMEF